MVPFSDVEGGTTCFRAVSDSGILVLCDSAVAGQLGWKMVPARYLDAV